MSAMEDTTKKKPSKPKPPVIRQTKTSIYRMAKANPLMVRDNKIQVEDKNVNLPIAVTWLGRLTLDDIEFKKFQESSSSNKSNASSKHNDLSLELKSNHLQQKHTTQSVLPLKSKNHDHVNMAVKPSISSNKSIDKFKKPRSVAPKAGKLRRSISSEHFMTDKKPVEKYFGTLNGTLTKSLSSQALNESRKSGLETFSKFVHYRSTPMPVQHRSTSNTTINKLQHPLKEWLRCKGKSLSNYQHLKCFGLSQLTEESKEEEKENIGNIYRCDSYDELRNSSTPQTAKDEKACTDSIVLGAIEDLHNLIITGYPLHHCEAWLDFIKQKCRNIEEQPQYWECRAAIEQGRGNISSAVECYKNSIINGANVNQIDESLGQLLTKFSLLNIEASNPADLDKQRKAREQEVCNIFKSTIIQFAIKERSLNMKHKNKVAGEPPKQFTGTPVRRSTRKSSSKFKQTPGKTLYDSWSDVESSMKEIVEFKNNSYLA